MFFLHIYDRHTDRQNPSRNPEERTHVTQLIIQDTERTRNNKNQHQQTRGTRGGVPRNLGLLKEKKKKKASSLSCYLGGTLQSSNNEPNIMTANAKQQQNCLVKTKVTGCSVNYKNNMDRQLSTNWSMFLLFLLEA